MTTTSVDVERLSGLAKALAHPARVQILQLLAQQSECMGAEIFAELPLAQSTVSEHLRVLRGAGLVRATPVGNHAVYCLRCAALDELAAMVGELSGLAAACDTGACS